MVMSDSETDAPQGEGPMVELARFSTLDDGLLAQGRLQADGIEAVVDDRSFSVLPVLSSGRPQVRVLVAQGDLERSWRSLAADHGADLQDIAESSLAPGPDERCPLCGSEDLMLRRFLMPDSLWAFALTVAGIVLLIRVLGFGIPGLAGAAAVLYAINVFVGPTIECKSCHHRWRARGER